MLTKGDIVTIDGATGEVMLGAVPLVRSTSDADFQQVRRLFGGLVGLMVFFLKKSYLMYVCLNGLE